MNTYVTSRIWNWWNTNLLYSHSTSLFQRPWNPATCALRRQIPRNFLVSFWRSGRNRQPRISTADCVLLVQRKTMCEKCQKREEVSPYTAFLRKIGRRSPAFLPRSSPGWWTAALPTRPSGQLAQRHRNGWTVQNAHWRYTWQIVAVRGLSCRRAGDLDLFVSTFRIGGGESCWHSSASEYSYATRLHAVTSVVFRECASTQRVKCIFTWILFRRMKIKN